MQFLKYLTLYYSLTEQIRPLPLFISRCMLHVHLDAVWCCRHLHGAGGRWRDRRVHATVRHLGQHRERGEPHVLHGHRKPHSGTWGVRFKRLALMFLPFIGRSRDGNGFQPIRRLHAAAVTTLKNITRMLRCPPDVQFGNTARLGSAGSFL